MAERSSEVRRDPATGMVRTECVCFPRCGHHLVERLLSSYFADKLHYGDPYEAPHRSMDSDPTINFQKNHDFELDTPVRSDRQYLILVRDPREALISWFRLEVRKGRLEYTREAWAGFSQKSWRFWGGFFDKWVVGQVPNRLVLDYRDLVAQPALALSRLVEFVSLRPACVDACREVVAQETIEPKSDAELFAFGESPGLESYP
jgi:hypothetical protein